MKHLPLFLLLFLVPVLTRAQYSDVRFGFEASPFISWLSSDVKNVKNDGANLGFQIFMNGEFYFRESYAIKTGLGLSFRNGGKLLHSDAGQIFPKSSLSNEIFREMPANSSVRYKLQYVEIPFAFRMRTQEIGYTRFYAEIPMFTLGICTQARGDLGLADGDNENIARDTRWLNLSWGLGGGMEYALTSTTSLIGGLYFQQGMTDVVSKSSVNRGKNELNKLVLRIGVMF
jgi:hypothetical protein